MGKPRAEKRERFKSFAGVTCDVMIPTHLAIGVNVFVNHVGDHVVPFVRPFGRRAFYPFQFLLGCDSLAQLERVSPNSICSSGFSLKT